MQILREPAATDAAGGGTPPAPATQAAARAVDPTEAQVSEFIKRLMQAPASNGGAPTTAVPASALPPDVATISKADLERLRAIEKTQAEQAAAAKAREEKLAMERGDFAKVLQARDADIAKRDADLAERDKRYQTAIRDRELAAALSGKPLVPGAADQLRRLWADDFEATAEADGYKVRSRGDYHPVADVVATRLKDPAYAHFLLPEARGGAGASGGQQTTATPPASGGATPPATLGEAMILQYQAANQKAAANPAVPVGLLGRRSG